MEKFETLNELIVALLFWITTNTEYKEPKKFPEVLEKKAGPRAFSSRSRSTNPTLYLKAFFRSPNLPCHVKPST